ncbi:MAG: pyroglutamyl-peptidase I [Planctomycetota bacterium]|jgi:pyroglutamyl-peptidase
MILVTGFEPFGGLNRNPSGEIAQALQGGPIEAAVLPVDYVKVVAALNDLLARPWDVVVLLGLAVGRPRISLERVAVNYRDPKRPDNAGRLPEPSAVVPDGPAAYFSTLPLERLHDAVTSAVLPAEISLSAGSYLCNTAFYLARHTLDEKGTPCGFIHLPPTPDLACAATPLGLEEQVRGLKIVLEQLRPW